MSRITYHLEWASGKTHDFEVMIDREPGRASSEAQPGEWTKLDCHQCDNCPLAQSSFPHCPVALDIEPIAKEFMEISSVERVDVTVSTADRTYVKNCDAQDALVSLFGLVMATSACPILSRLKPLAHFHLPFATMAETAHRLLGTYLIKQRVLYREDLEAPDWELVGIEDFYKELTTVNEGLIRRLQSASRQDANGNAINVFCSMTSLITFGIDDTIDDVAPLAKRFL